MRIKIVTSNSYQITKFYNWGIIITSVYHDLSIYLKRGLYHVTLFLVGDKLIKKKLSWHITWSSKIFTSFFCFRYFANNCKCISQFPFNVRLIMMKIMKLNKVRYPYILIYARLVQYRLWYKMYILFHFIFVGYLHLSIS